MTATPHVLTDSATMLRRNLRHALRYPSMTVVSIGMPVLLLLLFVGVFGGALGEGVGATAREGGYIDYIAPGIILMAVTSGCLSVSVAVSVDMTAGITARFRTMPIARSAILTGHVAGTMIQTVASTLLVVLVAVAMGFRPHAGPLDWLLVSALLLALVFALTWLAVGLGLVAKNPEGASNSPLLIQFLPFLGSAIVPTGTMPDGVRWFAEYQPFTPITETVRGLLTGTPIGHDGWTSAAWCTVIALAGYLWSRWLFDRDPSR
ncbi:ABC transporter permease [Actinomadura fibrosa]|uniref:Transport permease protein n=1 Tax=Actinomadura fibrosa TaxID=111802 RepID=A0ABW2XJR2_9ACTN|nr:ABC transporter permease [Actinomadura fibrosa]